MHARHGLTLLLAAALPQTAVAQWTLAPEVGVISFSPVGRDTATGIDLGPTRVTAFGFRVSHEGDRIGIALRLRYGTSGLAATDGDLTVVQEHAFKLYDVSGMGAWRLARLGTGTLTLEAGPALAVWKVTSGETRTRAGASAALGLTVALSPRYTTAIRAEAGVSPSIFDPVDLPPEVVRRTSWRYGVAIDFGRRF